MNDNTQDDMQTVTEAALAAYRNCDPSNAEDVADVDDIINQYTELLLERDTTTDNDDVKRDFRGREMGWLKWIGKRGTVGE